MKKRDIRRERILEFIESYTAERRCPPSVRDIQKELGIPSTSTVHTDINELQAKGLVDKINGRVAPKYTESYIEKIKQYLDKK